MPDTPAPLPAAEKYAALKALQAGLGDQIDKAATEALAEAREHRVKSWDTPYGPVNVARKAASIVINDAALLDHMLATATREDGTLDTEAVDLFAELRIRPGFKAATAAYLVIVAGDVVDTRTGEVVPWATAQEAGDPFIAYPSTGPQKDAKELARMLFEDNAERLTAGLRELTA